MMPIKEYQELISDTLAELCRQAVDAPTAAACVMHRAALVQICLKAVGLLCVNMPAERKMGVLEVLLRYFEATDKDYLEWNADLDAKRAIKEAAR